ncbi:MAG: hypothetical protein DLM67_16830 [Candidatus Nephthysia bennettiae]|nr:MAG: hypothetical protein DLM67_16830 [Candidatus Dormibacteraeota bacterium]
MVMALSQPAPGSVAGTPAVRNPHGSRPNWLYPTVVVVVFTAFVVYGAYVGLFETSGRYGPYLSPFFSPEIYVRIGGFLIPPGIWIAPFPLAFRLTCYYYRKAYYRAFLWHPRSCAVEEPHRGSYRGETRFWLFNNLHRFALYAIVVQMLVLLYDAVAAFQYQGSFHLGLGNVILVVNLVLLSGYTFGCHALRHLFGGTDCFSCHRVRYRLWKGVTVLNVNHETWAWASMLSVWATDLYIRLLIHGAIPHVPWN